MSANFSSQRPLVILVGGFLGSGKTSLILAAAAMLEARGIRCAAIFNDQAGELVDTSLAGLNSLPASEVTGGCFCCRFSDLIASMNELRSHAPEVIFAEPVGSCTDIAATVVGPLLEEFERCRVAPLTVLIDPDRATEFVSAEFDLNLKFLMDKQLQEADLVYFSKSDRHPAPPALAGVAARQLSSRTGQGVAEWLDAVLASERPPGLKLLDIDYDQYARAEAALAWLNLSLTLEPATPASPALVVGPFLDDLDASLTAAGVAIVHLKLIDRSPSGWIKAAICANGQEPAVEGALDASPSARHEILLNLRALGDPSLVRDLVECAVDQMQDRMQAQVSALHLECFSPAPPKPERRIIVSATSEFA